MQLIDSDEAARRLGVKVATLYAYVSRGLLESRRSPRSRKSLFLLEDIEELAARSRHGKETETRLASVSTAVTQITERGPLYRGQPVVDLVGNSAFEEVAELLWGGEGQRWPSALGGGRTVDVSGTESDRGRVRLIVVLAGEADPLRADRRPPSVRSAARSLINEASRSVGRGDEHEIASVAEMLGHGASPSGASEASVAAIDAALVLLADHELAASTLAVRIAASTRADIYDAIGCGLGVSGPLHLGASALAHEFLADVKANGADRAIGRVLERDSRPPGFGHAVYTGVDPRLTAFVPYLDGIDGGETRGIVESVLDASTRLDLGAPNIDLGMGALSLAIGAPPEFGTTVFTIARMAGWTAHYLEELEERPLRFRTRAVYVQP